MKRLVVIVLCLVLPLSAISQRRGKPFSEQVNWGIKGGVNLSKMHYTERHLADLPQQFAIRPAGGVFVDIPLSPFLGIAPEILYVERGMKTVYTHYSGYDIDYSIRSRYVDFRLPLMVGVNVTSWFQPYLLVGGDVGYLLGGQIHLLQTGLPHPELTVNLGKANMQPLYIGVSGGLGVRFFQEMNGKRAQLKVEATFNHGFVDSFSEKEHLKTALPENVNAYNITGKRFPQAIELSVGVTLPLIPDKRDACYGFSKGRWR